MFSIAAMRNIDVNTYIYIYIYIYIFYSQVRLQKPCLKVSSGKFNKINDGDLKTFMKMDVIRSVLSGGYPYHVVREVLRNKLERTGLPFLSTYSCTDSVKDELESISRNTSKNAATTASMNGIECHPDNRLISVPIGSSPNQEPRTIFGKPPIHKKQQHISRFNHASRASSPQYISTPREIVVNSSKHRHFVGNGGTPMKPGFASNVEIVQLFKNQPGISKYDDIEELMRWRDERLCKICMAFEIEVVLLPCKHMSTCSRCTNSLNRCPMCRCVIEDVCKPIIS